MKTTYRTSGTCSREIIVETEGTRVVSVEFVGGCDGNTSGISALVEGMEIDEVIRRLRGIRCGFKPTSFPDQLARALEKASAE